MIDIIRADTLVGYDVSRDGNTVRLKFSERNGGSGAFEVPSQLINHLLMNLPRVAEEALRRSQRNESLRLVHALDAFRIEQGEPGEEGAPRYVLTLRTHGGYEVPFAMTGTDLGVIVQTLVDQVLSDGAAFEPAVHNG